MLEYINNVCHPQQMLNPLFTMLGMEVVKVKDGKASLSLPILLGFQQGGGVVAGGILVTLADEAMALAAMSASNQHVVTSELNTRFLRSVSLEGTGPLIAEAEVIRSGRTIVTAESRVYDGDKRLLMVAGGSFVVLKDKKKSEGKAEALCSFPSKEEGWTYKKS